MTNQGDPPPLEMSPLSADGLARIGQMEAVVSELLRSRYGAIALSRTKEDLNLLQRLIDDEVLGADRAFELECLGAALGQVFASQTPLEWVMIDDQFGREPGLNYPQTSILVFPITMISKRLEDGRDVDLVPLYETIVTQIEKLRGDPEHVS